MRYAKGGYVPGPDAIGIDVPIRLSPGEKLISRDGRVWKISDDGEQVELIVDPQEDT